MAKKSSGFYTDKGDPSLKVRKNVFGQIEGRDPDTGEVIWVQKKKPTDGRGRRRKFVKSEYSEKAADAVLARVWEGDFLDDICREENFPVRMTIRNWTLVHPDFRARLKEAMEFGRKIRAEKSARQILKIADQPVIGKDRAAGERLKADIHMWNAERSDPENYGKQTKITGDSNAPLQFVISTGFPEPNQHQRPPELGEDGLIKKLPDITVEEDK